MNDVLLFDTKTEECRRVVDSDPFKFRAPGNQAVKIGTNQVLAVVEDHDDVSIQLI